MRGMKKQVMKTSGADVLFSRIEPRKTLRGGGILVRGLRKKSWTSSEKSNFEIVVLVVLLTRK